jgi:hypothetical protein
MRRFLVVLIVAAASICSAPLYAHHSFGAAYLENQTVTIEGQLVQLLFRNPHSFVHVMVREKDGTVVRYAIEWSGALQLGDQGVGRDTLKIGDRLVISGNPGRNKKDHLLRMITLHRPKDGFGWVTEDVRSRF